MKKKVLAMLLAFSMVFCNTAYLHAAENGEAVSEEEQEEETSAEEVTESELQESAENSGEEAQAEEQEQDWETKDAGSTEKEAEYSSEENSENDEEELGEAYEFSSSEYIDQAIWTEGNSTLTFFYGPQYKAGDTFRGKTILNVWQSVLNEGKNNQVSWESASPYVTNVVFDRSFLNVTPYCTKKWFNSFHRLKSIDFSGFNSSEVTTMAYMFSDCESLTSLDLSGFDTSKVTDMGDMFSWCSKLTSLDLSSFDTSKVTNMNGLFCGSTRLTSIDLSSFDTSKVTDMYEMFMDCNRLERIDLSGFDTSKVTKMGAMFFGCSSLSDLDLSSFDTSSVTDMMSMISCCRGLTSVDLSSFDTSNVKDFDSMFGCCSSLTSINISSFDVSSVLTMSRMFYDCSSLREIICSDRNTDWSKKSGSMMFEGCTSLIGSGVNGSVPYDSNKTNARMAKAASLGGYFTDDKNACGDHAYAVLDDNGTLKICGEGPMYNYDKQIPWWQAGTQPVTDIIIEDGITEIGNNAFAGCNVSAVYLPNSVTSIGSNAFNGSDLMFITIGENVQKLGDGCLGSCSKLESVYFLGTPHNISSSAFSGCGPIYAFYSPENASYWSGLDYSRYGADDITWMEWTDISFEFEYDQYTVALGETKTIFVFAESDTIPLYNLGFSYEPDDLFEFQWDIKFLYNSMIPITITGVQPGEAEITAYGYSAIDRNPLVTSAKITVLNTPAEENIPGEVHDQIGYSINDTYGFGNLTDNILDYGNGMRFYHRYFSPVQARMIAKADNGTGGQCYGMVCSAIATAFYNCPSVTSYSKNTLLKVKENSVSSDTNISAGEFIKYAHIYQYTISRQKESYQNGKKKLEDLYNAVADYLRDNSEPILINLNKANAGHALLARGIGKNTENYTEIIVYDSNHPKSQDRTLILNKRNGHYDSWQYEGYSSAEGANISWESGVHDFVSDFFSSSTNTTNSFWLVSPAASDVWVAAKDGKRVLLAPDNYSDLETVMPVVSYTAGSASGTNDLYWVKAVRECSFETAGEESSLEIAGPESGVEISLPAHSEAKVKIGDNTENAVEIITPGDSDYSVTFNDTNSEGTGVDSKTVSGRSEGNVAVAQHEDAIIVRGEDLGTVTVQTETGTESYTVPEDKNTVLIEADGTAVMGSTKDLSLFATAWLQEDLIEYTGEALTPGVVVQDLDGNTLTQGTDYSAEYLDNINIGTGRIIITGLGIYSGTIEKTFEIRSVYHVTYVLKGGTNNEENPAYYDKGTKLTLKAPTRTGYTFSGWYSDKKYKKKVTTVSGGDKKVYAKWTVNKYSIAFNANGGTGRMSKLTGISYSAEKTLTANAFKKKGYSFTGWNTKKDGSGDSYANKATVKGLMSENNAAITLYAQWKIVTYKITYNLNGGINDESNPATFTVQDNILLAKPTKVHYVSAGWYSDKYFRNKVTAIAEGSTGSRTLYAKWKPIKYTIIFDRNDEGATGSMNSLTGVSWNTTKTLTANAFRKKGYSFTGWNTEPDGTGTVYANSARVKNLAEEQGAKVTLYAQWKLKTYSINYNVNGGTLPEGTITSYNVHDETIPLAVPERAGYTFAGWYTDSGLTKKADTSISAGSTGKKTYYAKWKANKYTILFDGNGAASGTMSSLAMTYGTARTLPANSFRNTGHSFKGWSLTPDGNVKYRNKAAGVKNLTAENNGTVTLYAVWSE